METFQTKNSEEVIIRPIAADDYENLCEFFEKLATETIFTNQYVGRPRRSKEAFERQLNLDSLYRLVVCNKSGAIVGTCSILIERPDHPWLNRSCGFGIMLLKEYTGQGLGKYLIQKMEQWAKEKHLHRIEAQVRTKNIPAINLYLKLGYEIEGMARDAAFINGEWHSQYYISKILDN